MRCAVRTFLLLDTLMSNGPINARSSGLIRRTGNGDGIVDCQDCRGIGTVPTRVSLREHHAHY